MPNSPTITRDMWLGRLFYTTKWATIALVFFAYVGYSVFDNFRIAMVTPYMNGNTFALLNRLNNEFDMDPEKACARLEGEENATCQTYVSTRLVPLAASPEFMALVPKAIMPPEESYYEYAMSRWWWPAPMLRKDEHVVFGLALGELQDQLLPKREVDVSLESALDKFYDAMINLLLALFVLGIVNSLFIMRSIDRGKNQALIGNEKRTRSLGVKLGLCMTLVPFAALFLSMAILL